MESHRAYMYNYNHLFFKFIEVTFFMEANMKVLIIGSGGREHALGLAISKSKRLNQLFFAPGNPGTSQLGKNLSFKETDHFSILEFAKSESIDITIVGPEAPLVAGITDLFIENGLKIIGPTAEGAQLEGSKAWSKSFMNRHGIPTASYAVFECYDDSLQHIHTINKFPIVIKADGLAAGKGVFVVDNLNDAIAALDKCFVDKQFGLSGQRVVIESFLKGEEASIFAFTDGKSILPMVPAQDHKAIYDGDKGPNTGGMGAYSPAPVVTDAVFEQVKKQVFDPLLAGLKAEGIDYVGVVYAGLMIDKTDINVVEFNVRFGDPETQVVLPRLKTDLLEVFVAMSERTLNTINLEWSTDAVVGVVLASEGYPSSYETGCLITGIQSANQLPNCHVIHSGTRHEGDAILTNGGRVLTVVAQHDDLEIAVETAYQGLNQINFEGKYFRTDIAYKAFPVITPGSCE